MALTTPAHAGFVHGLSSFKLDDVELGLISEDSISFGGDEPSFTPVYAAQKRGAPVINLLDSPGSIVLEGDFIEINPTQLAKILGGTAEDNKWKAPTRPVVKEGKLTIVSEDGTTFTASRASLSARITGALKHNEVLKVHFKATILDNGKGEPYTIETPKASAPGVGVGG